VYPNGLQNKVNFLAYPIYLKNYQQRLAHSS